MVMISAVVALVMSFTAELLRMRTLAVRTQERWRSGLFDYILCQTPKNNADSTLAVLLFGCQGIDAVFPQNVNVATKSENTVVRLREVDTHLGLWYIGRPDKG
jgi:hypothetical protein